MTPKQRVALELLDSALQMYYAKSFFAAIHLAGAAEELFGAYLKLWKSAKPAADSFHDDAVQALGYNVEEAPASLSKQLYRGIFHSRNRTKHMNPQYDHDISFDPLYEAEAVLVRALSNFYEVADMLGVRPTRRMYRFYRQRFSD
jgi:hypothetical protein